MNKSSGLLLAVCFALPFGVAGADAKFDLKDALKKLAAAPNYSWTLTARSEGSAASGRQGPIEGKTEKDSFTILSGTAGETPFQAAAKGDRVAVNYADEWVIVEEDSEETGRIARRLKGVRSPLSVAEDMAGKVRELKKETDGPLSGDLSAEAALKLFQTLGRRAAEATEAKGSAKFWLKDGALAKYEFTVKGAITLRGDNREVDISRTVTVEFKDVGVTKVTLPEEAKKKLSL